MWILGGSNRPAPDPLSKVNVRPVESREIMWPTESKTFRKHCISNRCAT